MLFHDCFRELGFGLQENVLTLSVAAKAGLNKGLITKDGDDDEPALREEIYFQLNGLVL